MSDSEPPDTAAPRAERLGAYRVEGRLGQGGMGEVFLGYDERLDRRVALKRIRHGRTGAHQRERFRREARAVARLSHPSIVQVYDLLEDSSGDCLVLELVPGETLRERLGRGPLGVAEAVGLAVEVAEGLAAAHEAGIVHRDLKAENVVVTPAGRAKILDFGLAKLDQDEAELEPESALTAAGTILGTSHAMSPEQASGGEVDARSDLFSLGVLLYEMLTGRSPFLGAHALDTLKRVLTLHPPPPGSLRPDLPPALDALVLELLSKEPGHRPRSAQAVARALEELARLPAGMPASPPTGPRISDLPTGEALPVTLPRPGPGLPATGASPRRGVAAAVAAVAGTVLLLALAAVAVFLASRDPAPRRRVAVAPPEVAEASENAAEGEAAQLALVASGVLGAALDALASFEGLAPLDPAQLGGNRGTPTALARAAAADEVLTSRVERAGALCRVSLRRIRGDDGQVLWAKAFDVPPGPEDLHLVGTAVRAQLRQAYPDLRLRPGVPELEARDGDYATFLAIRGRLGQGSAPPGPELPRLAALLETSPRFLEGHLLAARVAHNLFLSTRDAAYLERAARWAAEAERLAPGDPRPLVEGFRVALARGGSDAAGTREAAAALERLAPLAPGDPEILTLRASLAEQQGDAEGAAAALREAVRRAPSWQNLFRLADLEYRQGRIGSARGHLETLLDRAPDNLWGLQKLAEVELMAGDLGRAEAIYRDLVRRAPMRSNYTNLGLARFLRGRPGEAVAAYRQALELDPGHPTVLVNLADAELARGREDQAREAYAHALEALEAAAAESPMSPFDRMLQAQCLARLGRSREAVTIVLETLSRSPNNPEILYLASLVHAVAGERSSALGYAQGALRQGVRPRWFRIHPLHGDPELRALLTQGR